MMCSEGGLRRRPCLLGWGPGTPQGAAPTPSTRAGRSTAPPRAPWRARAARPSPQAPLVSWTSYFVICTVISRPQLLAVLARMEKAAEEEWGRVKRNSPGSSPWEVLDYGDGAWGGGAEGACAAGRGRGVAEGA
jgi:hypothetical protein